MNEHLAGPDSAEPALGVRPLDRQVRDMTISDAGGALIDRVVRTANGRVTAAETLGHRGFVLTKLFRSA